MFFLWCYFVLALSHNVPYCVNRQQRNTRECAMNIHEMKVGDVLAIAVMFGGQAPAVSVSKPDGRAVIVRSRDAGVQFGYLDRIEGSTVYLTKARQMWSWTAASGGTLLDCATHGVKAGKFSTFASGVIVIGACAVIDCTPEAVKRLEDAKWA